MLACGILACCAVYMVGLRADRVNSARTVREAGMSRHEVATAVKARPIPVSLTLRPTGLYRGKPARFWAFMYRERTRQLQQARRALWHKASTAEAINLACAVYGNCQTLWSLARCESNLNPNARNASGSSGLMQFMPSTFRSTPFRGFSIWSPYANALAAGWMVAQGRRGEWVC